MKSDEDTGWHVRLVHCLDLSYANLDDEALRLLCNVLMYEKYEDLYICSYNFIGNNITCEGVGHLAAYFSKKRYSYWRDDAP